MPNRRAATLGCVCCALALICLGAGSSSGVRASEVRASGVAGEGDENGEQTLLPFGADGWRYLDTNEYPGRDWIQPEFDDESWKVGKALLGYGDDDHVTVLSFGENRQNKHPVAWFRKTVTIESRDELVAVGGRLVCDDGGVVYVNGKEVYRFNMPEGEIAPHAWAMMLKGGERWKWPFMINADLFLEGENVIAVSVHQRNATSSDIAFDLELRAATDEKARARLEKAAAQTAAKLARQAEERRVARLRGLANVVLQDGEFEIQSRRPWGVQRQKYVHDVLEQALEGYGIRFVRVYAGDTLEKVAVQAGVRLERLLLLNRVEKAHVYQTHDLACVHWPHDGKLGETIDGLAKTYQTNPEVLRRLNFWKADEAPSLAGQQVMVPGEFAFTPGDGSTPGSLALFSTTQRKGKNAQFRRLRVQAR